MKTMKVIASVRLTDTPATHILEVFTRLQNDYNVELITLNTPNTSNVTKLSKEINIRQVPFTQYNIPLLKGFFYEMYIILHILCSREKIDVLYSRSRPFNFAEYVIHKLKKIPLVIEVNGILIDEILMETPNPSFLTSLRMKIVSFIERKTLSISSKIITVTPNIKNRLQKDYNLPDEKMVVIENGANIRLFKPDDNEKSRKKLGLNENYNYITFLGNLAPWQGVEFLVKSAPLILKEIPNVKFLIVGDGSTKEKLLEIVDDLNLHDHFIFTGMVPYEEVPKYINAGDICVAPFIRERNESIGLSPLKIYEYLACGKAVVSSRIPNLEFIEENEVGILVEPENPKKIANAAIKLLKNDKLRDKMGKNGREYLIKHNNWDVITDNIKEILERKVLNIYPQKLQGDISKVLIISFFFNQEEIGSVRIKGLANNLIKLGWEPTILTVKSKDQIYPFRVIGTEYNDLIESWKIKLNLNPEKTVDEQFNPENKSKTLVDYIVDIWSDFFAYPDFEKNWYEPALKAGSQLLENENFDAIISTSSPVTSHLVANKLKEKYDIPWIADLRDLWTQNHYYLFSRIRKIIDGRLEKNVLSNANALITVSHPLVRKLKEKHEKKDIFSIPNGFNVNNKLKVKLSSKFNIVYTGYIYHDKMDPEPFLKALSELTSEGKINQKDCEVNFYGIEAYWLRKLVEKNNLENVVKFHGWIDRNIVLHKQKEAQLLLLLNWNDPNEKGVYTGKVFEYLAAKRPIISIGQYGGVIEELLNETNAGVNLGTVNEIKNELIRAYSEFKSFDEVRYKGINREINKYSHEEMAKKFVKVLETVV